MQSTTAKARRGEFDPVPRQGLVNLLNRINKTLVREESALLAGDQKAWIRAHRDNAALDDQADRLVADAWSYGLLVHGIEFGPGGMAETFVRITAWGHEYLALTSVAAEHATPDRKAA